jgi:EpsD family peptidyl-prolyl cis-trans isomerase
MTSTMIPHAEPARTSLPGANRARSLLVVATAALALAGCERLGIGGGGAPTGQVVATLDGQEITVLEVNAELAGTPIPPTMSRRDAEKLALENILTRRMLSKAAEERELDKKPEFLLQERRASEQLRVQSLARDIAGKVVAPTRDETEKFMSENPYLFAQRQFFILDQIQFLRPANIEKLGLEGADTMAEVEQILTAAGIQFRRQPASLDSLGANPTFVKEVTNVLAKNPQELFMFATRPEGAPAPVVLVNQVKETRVQPFVGDRAREYAGNFLRNERIQNALKVEVERQRKSQADRVVFQAGWEPAKKKPGEAAAAAAAGMQADAGAAAPAPVGAAPAVPAPAAAAAAPPAPAAEAAAPAAG